MHGNFRKTWTCGPPIGVLKRSNLNWRDTLLQIARYVRDVFPHQPSRGFGNAFTLCGMEMETWDFDWERGLAVSLLNQLRETDDTI